MGKFSIIRNRKEARVLRKYAEGRTKVRNIARVLTKRADAASTAGASQAGCAALEDRTITGGRESCTSVFTFRLDDRVKLVTRLVEDYTAGDYTRFWFSIDERKTYLNELSMEDLRNILSLLQIVARESDLDVAEAKAQAKVQAKEASLKNKQELLNRPSVLNRL